MDLREAHHLIIGLEKTHGPESVYRPTVEKLIGDLMEATFNATDPQEKIELAALELRARGVRQKWKVQNQN